MPSLFAGASSSGQLLESMSFAGFSYPEAIEIKPLSRPPNATVRVPGSKSITNRALVMAALFGKDRPCFLENCLKSEDTEVMVSSLQALGFQIDVNWSLGTASVAGRSDGNRIPVDKAELFVGNSGTTMRFLSAMVCLGHGRYRLDGIPRMRERPIGDLLAALQQLGVNAISERNDGCPPVVVQTDGLPGGKLTIRGKVSSQFLSGLLLAAPYARDDVGIEIQGPMVSRPYVEMTLGMMDDWGLPVIRNAAKSSFRVSGRQRPVGGMRYWVEPDATAASYFFAAAALAPGQIAVSRLNRKSLQGDVVFVDVLEKMGCQVDRRAGSIIVQGAPLHGINVDMNDISDTVMTLAAVACFAEGPTTIRNVAHIRHKETDRLTALAAELRRVGAGVEEFADGLTIIPRPLHGAEIETYNDHRMAMSMALIGLKVPGIVIKNPGCVAKTYPGFFDDLEKLRGSG
ncbi:MAG: 3-phosphoshikimate 1-carboxyvinyltransferase [Gemmataceae bacterium]